MFETKYCQCVLVLSCAGEEEKEEKEEGQNVQLLIFDKMVHS